VGGKYLPLRSPDGELGDFERLHERVRGVVPDVHVPGVQVSKDPRFRGVQLNALHAVRALHELALDVQAERHGLRFRFVCAIKKQIGLLRRKESEVSRGVGNPRHGDVLFSRGTRGSSLRCPAKVLAVAKPRGGLYGKDWFKNFDLAKIARTPVGSRVEAFLPRASPIEPGSFVALVERGEGEETWIERIRDAYLW